MQKHSANTLSCTCKIGKKIFCLCNELLVVIVKTQLTIVHTLLYKFKKNSYLFGPWFCTATITLIESQESVIICLEHIWHRSSWELVTLHFWHKNRNYFLCQRHNVTNFWRTGKGKFSECFRSFGRFNLDLIFRDVQSLK